MFKKQYPAKEDDLLILAEALMGGTDNAIRNQEKRGQRGLVESEVLPHKFNYCTRQQFEKMGIVFGEQADDLFTYVTLPKGWKKVATDHDMWSKLVDNKGRERASIFYKAAFYDRDAFLNITRRFTYGYQPVLGYSNRNYQKGGWIGVALDGDKVIYKTEELEPEPSDRKAWLAWSDRREALSNKAKAWLDKKYPKWNDPLEYW